MAQIRFATAEDLGRLGECEVQIWESLREWLPDSFVSPNINNIQRQSTCRTGSKCYKTEKSSIFSQRKTRKSSDWQQEGSEKTA